MRRLASQMVPFGNKAHIFAGVQKTPATVQDWFDGWIEETAAIGAQELGAGLSGSIMEHILSIASAAGISGL